jgi:hypothetical protein
VMTVTDTVTTASVAARAPAMGAVGWRTEAGRRRWSSGQQGRLRQRVQGRFRCAWAFAVPAHHGRVSAATGAALPAEATTALAAPVLLVGADPPGRRCVRGLVGLARRSMWENCATRHRLLCAQQVPWAACALQNRMCMCVCVVRMQVEGSGTHHGAGGAMAAAGAAGG